MAEIMMFGVNHLDPKAEGELTRRIFEFSPQLILLEGSDNHRHEIYSQKLDHLIQTGQIREDVGAVLKDEHAIKGFEERVAAAYRNQRGQCQVDYLNDLPKQTPEDISAELERLRESVKDRNAQEMASELAQSRIIVKQFLQTIKERVGTKWEMELFYILPARGIGIRDALMSRTLREKIKNGSGKIATINGMAHVLHHPQGRTFFDLVQDLSPKRTII